MAFGVNPISPGTSAFRVSTERAERLRARIQQVESDQATGREQFDTVDISAEARQAQQAEPVQPVAAAPATEPTVVIPPLELGPRMDQVELSEAARQAFANMDA